jgi:hypothetical protein
MTRRERQINSPLSKTALLKSGSAIIGHSIPLDLPSKSGRIHVIDMRDQLCVRERNTSLDIISGAIETGPQSLHARSFVGAMVIRLS